MGRQLELNKVSKALAEELEWVEAVLLLADFDGSSLLGARDVPALSVVDRQHHPVAFSDHAPVGHLPSCLLVGKKKKRKKKKMKKKQRKEREENDREAGEAVEAAGHVGGGAKDVEQCRE